MGVRRSVHLDQQVPQAARAPATYFYTYAAEAHRTGAPLNRSLVLEYPDDPKTWDDTTKYEFLAGKEFLVAPMWGADEVKGGIYLPKATGSTTGPAGLPGPDHGERLPRSARHPAAVREAGAVVPMWKAGINNAAEQGFGDRLTLDIYPQGKSSLACTRTTASPARPSRLSRVRRGRTDAVPR